MPTNSNLTEAAIRKLLQEYFNSGCTLDEFCTIEDHDVVMLQAWLDKFYPEHSDDGFMDGVLNPNLKEELRDEPKKPGPKPRSLQMPFAEIGDIKLWHPVSAAFLKSLKG